MADIRKLINQLASQEKLLGETEFLAPCVLGGAVRTRVDNLIYTFKPQPNDFEGWGIFHPIGDQVAELIDEPNLAQIASYLQWLKPFRVRLCYPLRGLSWLAYPVNESDMQQRFAKVKPIPVHLVTQGAAFEVIIARCDGSSWWFDEVDRRAEVQPTLELTNRWREQTPPEQVKFLGMTPEMVTCYHLAWQQTDAYQATKQVNQPTRKQKYTTEEQRISEALQVGGGNLEQFRDRGDFWQVEWRTADGELHSSAIEKNDLTVISSGICLSGRDRDFDLQSLVGVVQGRNWD